MSERGTACRWLGSCLCSLQPAADQVRRGTRHVLNSRGALQVGRAHGCTGGQEGEVAGHDVRMLEGSVTMKATLLHRKGSSPPGQHMPRASTARTCSFSSPSQRWGMAAPTLPLPRRHQLLLKCIKAAAMYPMSWLQCVQHSTHCRWATAAPVRSELGSAASATKWQATPPTVMLAAQPHACRIRHADLG